jgi:hypothetical protein
MLPFKVINKFKIVVFILYIGGLIMLDPANLMQYGYTYATPSGMPSGAESCDLSLKPDEATFSGKGLKSVGDKQKKDVFSKCLIFFVSIGSLAALAVGAHHWNWFGCRRLFQANKPKSLLQKGELKPSKLLSFEIELPQAKTTHPKIGSHSASSANEQTIVKPVLQKSALKPSNLNSEQQQVVNEIKNIFTLSWDQAHDKLEEVAKSLNVGIHDKEWLKKEPNIQLQVIIGDLSYLNSCAAKNKHLSVSQKNRIQALCEAFELRLLNKEGQIRSNRFFFDTQCYIPFENLVEVVPSQFYEAKYAKRTD